MTKEKAPNPEGTTDLNQVDTRREAIKRINELEKEVLQNNPDLKKRLDILRDRRVAAIKEGQKSNRAMLTYEVYDFQVDIFLERIAAIKGWDDLNPIVDNLLALKKEDTQALKPALMLYFYCTSPSSIDRGDLKFLIKGTSYKDKPGDFLNEFNNQVYRTVRGVDARIELKPSENDLWEHVLPTVESLNALENKGGFINRLFGLWPPKARETLGDPAGAKTYFERAKTYYKKYPQAENLLKPLKYSAEKVISSLSAAGDQQQVQEFLISLVKEDRNLLKAIKLDCREMGIDKWEAPTQEEDKKNWEIAMVVLGINKEAIFNRWMEEAKQKNTPPTRLELEGELDEKSAKDFAARMEVYEDTGTNSTLGSSWEERDLSRGVQRSKELEGLRGESTFNAWTDALAQEATDLFAYAAAGPQYQIDGVDYDFLKENAKLFVEELAVDRYQSRGFMNIRRPIARHYGFENTYENTGDPKLGALIEQNPDFLTLLGKTASSRDFGVLRLGELSKTLGQASLDHRLQSIDALQAYKKRKEAILQSAQQQVRSAQERYDAREEGLTSNETQYLKWMQDYVGKDLPRILDSLPFLLGEDKANVQRMSSRLLRVNTFPSIDIRPQKKGVGGTAYDRRYELSDNLSTYEQFQNTSIHELMHVLIEGPNSTSIFSYNLGEGITEFLTHNTLKRSGIDPSDKREKGYPQVYAFAELLDGLDPQCLAVFYTREKIPTVSFSDLPKISVDGRAKTYIDGVNLNTPEKKYLCRVILDQLGPQYLTNEGNYPEQRAAYEPINSVLKKIFNTEFTNKDYDGPMGKHYGNVQSELKNVLIHFR
ncbi:MAG: hypothetical protein WC882_03075 [Candidatus Gracilibacteria bacterium]